MIELDPNNRAYKRRAECHFCLKQYSQVLADLTKAVELKPGDFSNLTWISPEDVAKCEDARLRDGLLELAEKTIQATKGATVAYATRGVLLNSFGQPEKALADVRKARELVEKKREGRAATAGEFASVGEAFRHLGLMDEAIAS